MCQAITSARPPRLALRDLSPFTDGPKPEMGDAAYAKLVLARREKPSAAKLDVLKPITKQPPSAEKNRSAILRQKYPVTTNADQAETFQMFDMSPLLVRHATATKRNQHWNEIHACDLDTVSQFAREQRLCEISKRWRCKSVQIGRLSQRHWARSTCDAHRYSGDRRPDGPTPPSRMFQADGRCHSGPGTEQPQ